ncbi:MAG: hypothetical protein F6K41_09390 [Symploca sp. SIO3E6]|nr:hypothetical protein [Caldora sp. SIO3E6]
MKKIFFRNIVFLAITFAILSMITLRAAHASNGASWVSASPPRSCSEVCTEVGLLAVTSGKDKFGYNFHVCRGRASNGELRPGFNIETSSDSAGLCLFEYGGGRGQSNDYDCLGLRK